MRNNGGWQAVLLIPAGPVAVVAEKERSLAVPVPLLQKIDDRGTVTFWAAHNIMKKLLYSFV